MSAPIVANRGRPFTMRPALAVSGFDSDTFDVDAPGFEDWNIVLVRKARGWRAYQREVITGYSLAWGRGGQTIHYRDHALRRDDGRLLGACGSADALLRLVQRAMLRGEVLPA